MKTRINLFGLALSTTFVVLVSATANAAIMDLTNGNFETSAANSNGGFPAPWYSGHPGSWEEFRYAGLGSYTGTAAALGSENSGAQSGYLYQQVGTYEGELSVTINGTAYSRDSGNGIHVFGDMDVAFYFTSGTSFAPAEGTDVASSGTLIGSLQEFQEGVNLPGITSGANGGTSSAFSHTALFAGSGINVGDEVWIRFSDSNNIFGGNTGTARDEPFFDDLSVSAESAIIPEVGSFAMLGVGVMGVVCLMWRRRK